MSSGLKYPDADWTTGVLLAHRMWHEVSDRTRVYWPDDRDAYLELYQSLWGGETERARRYGDRPENSYFGDDGVVHVDGYPEPDLWTAGSITDTDNPGFVFKEKKVKMSNINGSAYTTLGTRFWWEITQRGRKEPVEIDPIRIPAPEALRDDIEDWARDIGGEVTRVKGAVFDERFGSVSGGGEAPKGHQDFHIKYGGARTRDEVMGVFEGALDLVERGVRISS